MRSNVGRLPAISVSGVMALAGCEFSDTIGIGHHELGAGTAGQSGEGSSQGGHGGGLIGVGGIGAGAAAGTHDSLCGIEAPSRELWVEPADSPASMAPGTGGMLVPGEYQLTNLVKHGACPCFDAAESLTQTISLGPDGTGLAISEYDNEGPYFASKFTFTVQGNTVRVTPVCTEPPGVAGQRAPFGSFETFTANGSLLSLISEACSYRADYKFVPRVPSR